MEAEVKNPGDKPIATVPSVKRRWQALSLIFLCFIAGALGSMIVVFSQSDVRNTVNTSNTRQVVSSEGELVTQIASEVGKSTVSITTETVSDDTFFGRSATEEGAGTGFIVSKDGYVMTNRHVVPAGVTGVTVVLSDGTEYNNVKVVGRDTVNDVAFLKINNVNNLPAVTIGDSSKMKVGQRVIAIGNALGQFQNSVTTGIISGLGRPIVAGDESGQGAEQLENLFQTDAAINPGNSGGPLVNVNGEVIGINVAVAQDAQGIGFAIPINDVKGLIKSVTEQGKLIRPYLGIRYRTLTPDIAKQLHTNVTQGAYITRDGIAGGSPAEKAGLKSGDIITKVNDQLIDKEHSFGSVISQFAVGDTIKVTFQRDGKEQTVNATLGAVPEN
ncbi:MAG TPA: trypsin-like peptidase domain-containing protein [Candidatus Saccharimonadales bacterium]